MCPWVSLIEELKVRQYLDLMKDIIENGHDHEDRTGVGRRSVFGRQLRFKMSDGFPLVTTRTISTKALKHELLWFISGSKNNKELNKVGVHIWDPWAIKEKDKEFFNYAGENDYDAFEGSIGNIYGPAWRNAPGHIDQLQRLITELKERPFSSRLVISAWIPSWIPNDNLSPAENVLLGKGVLAPCHVLQQYIVKQVDGVKYLSLLMYQRSTDTAIGAPYNIAQYAMLLHMMAQVVGMVPDEFIWSSGDTHLYLNQLELAKEQIMRKPLGLPTLELNKDITSIDDFRYDDIRIMNYHSDGKINYPVAV